MSGKHKKTVKNRIESTLADDPMPDDAVLPVEELSVATGSAAKHPENEAAETTRDDDPLAGLQQELAAHKKQAAEHLDKALRAQAELDNVRKRASRDVENAHKYALERFVTELLPVMDSMEMGIAACDQVEDSMGLKQGMELTQKIFAAALEKFGVKAIDPQGEKFNPERHEAVTLQQVDNMEPGMVISVMQKGYELNGRLVRPAMVIVSRCNESQLEK